MRYILFLFFLFPSLPSGFGQFSTEKLIFSCQGCTPSDVFSSDIDGDGDMDVLSAAQSGNHIAWYENDGKGNFSEQKIISTQAEGAIKIFAADLDMDGDMDALYASQFSGEIAWSKNDEDGNFAEKIIIVDANPFVRINSIYAADLDGDGLKDVLFTTTANQVAWSKNQDVGNFLPPKTISIEAKGASDIFAIDLDKDGDIDVLSASFGNDILPNTNLSGGISKIAWYENDGDGHFSELKTISLFGFGITVGKSKLFPADFDADGDIDVLGAYSYDDDIIGNPKIDRLWWHENDGMDSISFKKDPSTIATDFENINRIYAADVDCDGDLDALTASIDDNTIAWFENDGNGNFSKLQLISDKVSGAVSVFATDLDADGDEDVLAVAASSGKIVWYENLYKSTTSTRDLFNESPLRVYPNPFTDFINIEQAESCFACHTFLLFDARGCQMATFPLTNTISSIPAMNMESGLYFYQILNAKGQQIMNGKLIK